MAAAAAQAARPAETCPFATSVPISPTSRSDPLSTWIDSPSRPPASPFLPSPWEPSRPNSVNAECWDCLEPLGPKHKDFPPLHPSHGLAFSKGKSQNGVLKVSSLSSSGSGGSSAGSGACSDENRNLVVSANGFSYSSRHMNSEKQMMNNSAESRAGVGESKGFSHRIANSHQQLRQQVNNVETPESWNSANGRAEGKGNKETFTEQQKRGFLGWVGDDNDSIKEEEVKGGKIKANEGRKAEAADDGVHQSADSVIGLKLGKRTYFEDATGSGSAKPPNGQQNSAVTTKKLKGSSQANQVPRCQVEGCKADLSSAKEYHRRHKVCEMHSKTPKNVVAGQEQRFCQQCSRFHGLSEFDEGKRSCRRRLAGHNERRRKPPPDVLTAVSAANFSLFQENKWPGFLSHQQALPTTSYLENSVISDYMNESWARYRKLDDHIGMNCQTQFPGASRNVSTDGLLMLLQNSKRQMMPMTSNTSRSHPFMKSPMGQGLTLSSPSVVIDNPASSHCLSAMSDSGHALSLLSAESCPNSVSMDLSAHSNTTLGHLIAENHPSPLHHQLMEDNLQERQLLKTKKFLSAQAHSDDNIVNIANTLADGPNCSQHQGSSIASIGIADYLENNSMLSMFQDRSIQSTNTHARPMIDLMQIPHRQTLHSSQQNVTHNPEFSDFHSIFQSQQMI